ncbi:MAG: HEAT repeat domain-containing protein [Desulfocapsaceae bacterium]|nr:HEAT repeat domain-containing protein [Desulfocapsaceae bacterium]
MNKGRIVKRPWCPFCGQKVEMATDAPWRKMREFPVGRCQCGAVYSCDPTGHNVGAAMVETLVYACDDNWDFAWELMPEDDYLTGRIENYDETTHQVVDLKNIDGRPVRGVLYFVRLHTDIAEVSRRVSDKKQDLIEQMGTAEPDPDARIEPLPEPGHPKEKANKTKVKNLALAGDVDALVALCLDDRKTLRLLQRLLYTPEDEERWYIAWVIGRVSARVASREPGQVSELLHRLFQACSDSAATPWGMVETIGSVIAGRPDIFGAFTRHLLGYMGERSTQEQVIWAMAEIAVKRPDLIRDTPFFNLFHFLGHPEPSIRGQVARLLGRIKATEVALQLMGLNGDTAELTIWENGTAVRTTVAAEAAKALAAIHGGKKNE